MNALVNYSDDEDDQLSNASASPQREEQAKKPVESSKPVESTSKPKQETVRQEKEEEKSSSQRQTPQKEEWLPSTVLRNLGDIEAIWQRRALLRPLPIEGIENWGIPPEPDTPCDGDREAKVAHFLSLRESGHKLNEHLQRNKAFRNPRIYAKLVEFIELDEIGSNFPKEEFDPHGFPQEAYIDGLLDTQRRFAEERAMAQQNRSSIPFVPSTASAAAATPSMVQEPSSRPNAAALAAAKANAQKVASRIVRQSSQPPSSSPLGEKRKHTADDRWDSSSSKQRR